MFKVPYNKVDTKLFYEGSQCVRDSIIKNGIKIPEDEVLSFSDNLSKKVIFISEKDLNKILESMKNIKLFREIATLKEFADYCDFGDTACILLIKHFGLSLGDTKYFIELYDYIYDYFHPIN